MNNNWIDPNLILSSVATGDNYYLRNEIVEDIWSELKKAILFCWLRHAFFECILEKQQPYL